MITRRSFLKRISAAGAALFIPKSSLKAESSRSDQYYKLHSFIEQNPDAVFIMKTDVSSKTAQDEILNISKNFFDSIILPCASSDQESVSSASRVAIKPNLTSRGKWSSKYNVYGSMGVVTDAYFTEGLISRLNALGVISDNIYLREVNSPEDFSDSGYTDLAYRTGVHIDDLSSKIGTIDENNIVWKDVPEGIYFDKIPYLWPVNDPDTMLINISKLKAHSMGMTLCAKNLQGSIAHYYQAHCTPITDSMTMNSEHIKPNAVQTIMDNYNRHLSQGIPRWDRPGTYGGLWQETWATRCLDNNLVTRPHIHIIEGIYGRDGHFMDGPASGYATDFMTNVIVFGKNAFHVDVIGHWLGGHEPGNFGLLHLAIERGLSSFINPSDVPLFSWEPESGPEQKELSFFSDSRTDLKTLYLRRDYNGQTEPYWHLCNEPYDYAETGVQTQEQTLPHTPMLHNNFPNPFNPSTTIQYTLPEHGMHKLDILNIRGEILSVLKQGHAQRGTHTAFWNAGSLPSGTYFYRLTFNGHVQTHKMLLVR